MQLDQLHPDLNDCLAFSEPGVLATPTALYAVLLGAEGSSTNGRICVVRWTHAAPGWQYLGSFLVNATDGPTFGVDGFTAPALYENAGSRFLIVTPQVADRYEGTVVFRISDLDAALLQRTAGIPDVTLRFSGTPGSHNGAAAYVPEAWTSGVVYSEALLVSPIRFRIYLSGRNP